MFGSKTPNCLAKNEMPLTSGLPRIPKIPKLTDHKRSASPFDSIVPSKPIVVDEPVDVPTETFKREPETNNRSFEVKEEPVESIKVRNTKSMFAQIIFLLDVLTDGKKRYN